MASEETVYAPVSTATLRIVNRSNEELVQLKSRDKKAKNLTQHACLTPNQMLLSDREKRNTIFLQ